MTNVVLRPHRMTKIMEQCFDNFFANPFESGEAPTTFVPRVNVTSDDDNLILTFELPGLDRKDIKVLVKDDVLTVSGERKFNREEKEDGYVRSEIASGSFSRSFTLPENLVTEKVTADYKNGLLQVTIPKAEEVKPKEVEVSVG